MNKYFCDSCGKEVPAEEQRYVLRVELYAAPEVVISKEEIDKDHKAEMAKIYEKMKTMDNRKLTEQVYTQHKFDLCPNCRNIFLSRVKYKEFV